MDWEDDAFFFFGESVSEEERIEADRFFAELMGEAWPPPRARRIRSRAESYEPPPWRAPTEAFDESHEPSPWEAPTEAFDEATAVRRGDLVRWVQTSLNRVQQASLSVDGDLGRLTRGALRRYQQRRGIPVDGRLLGATLHALAADTRTLPQGVWRGPVPSHMARRPDLSVPCPGNATVLEGFPFAQHGLTATHRAQLAELARRVVQSQQSSEPVHLLCLEGHTDSVGAHDTNERLGQQRADTVEAELLAQIDRGSPGLSRRLGSWATTSGEARPAVPNTTPANRARNRRVEVHLNNRWARDGGDTQGVTIRAAPGSPRAAGRAEDFAGEQQQQPQVFNVPVGRTMTLIASGRPTPPGNPGYTWTSSDPAVVRVSFYRNNTSQSHPNSADITALRPGRVTITVTYKASTGQTFNSSVIAVGQAANVAVSIQILLRWPDSEVGNAAFLGTPITLGATRRPYLHPTRPTSYRQAIDLRSDAAAIPLAAGANPGEFETNTNIADGTRLFLIVPEHVFVRTTVDAANAWQRRVRFDEIEAANRVFGLPLRMDGGTLKVTPVGGEEEDWGAERRSIYAMAILPYLQATPAPNLTDDWQTATAALRTAVGEYPPFAESQLPPHRPLTAVELAAVRAAHQAPVDFIRFITTGQRTFVDVGGPLFLESLLWDERTMNHAAPAVRSVFLPVPKRSLVTGIESLRAAVAPAGEFLVRTGFVPPNRFAAAFAIRAVGAENGFRVNQIRHIFGDAVDLDRDGGDRLSVRNNRRNLAGTVLPWPDTAAAQALRGAFDFMQFERLMLTTGAAAVERRYVLHVDKRDYDLPMLAGVYQFRVNQLVAANGHVNIRNDLVAANANYADLVIVVPQGVGVLPNAFYPSQLNNRPAPANQVFQAVNNNPNLDSLLTDMDGANQFATINVGPRNVNNDADVQAMVEEIYTLFGAHASFLGVTFDLEWYTATADATPLLTNLVAFIRANHPTKRLFPIWFGMTVGRMDWTLLQPLSDILIPIYDGLPGHNWGNNARDQWGAFILNNEVLERVWDSNRNIRVYGHNILTHGGIGAADFPNALSWLGRMSRLYGSSNFAFQFNNYGQNWRGHTADLQNILQELG